jgi:predicted DNA-binding transcriptional regulator AlpA
MATRLSVSESSLLTVTDVAALLGLPSARSVYNRLHRGTDFPPPVRVGASLRWRAADVDAWLDAQVEGGVRR